ncbi:MAG: ASCH domain-containing protein [Chloroflexi bacterium]|nr:ASCH domain-containing protein [Chloroflexota bacterium]
MTPVLLGIHPRHADAILRGSKTVELRRRFPAIAAGTTVYLYASAPVSAVVGAFEVTGVAKAAPSRLWRDHGKRTAIDKAEFERYFSGVEEGHAVLVGSPVTFSNPLRLSQLISRYGILAPQNFRFVTSASLRRVLAGRCVPPSSSHA